MNLIIDQGNSVTKMAIFQGNRLQSVNHCTRWDADCVNRLLDSCPVEAAIFSSVANEDGEALQALRERVQKLHIFDHSSRLPIRIDYQTPHTLGLDRIAAAAGAAERCPGRAALIIDAGTCVTFDTLTPDGVFAGGNIAPGIEMRLRALHQFTARLPKVDSEGDTPETGYSTETAMRSGCVTGLALEIEGYIARKREADPDLLFFLTGGDALKLAAKIKNRIFVDENLVLNGLNRILHENIEI